MSSGGDKLARRCTKCLKFIQRRCVFRVKVFRFAPSANDKACTKSCLHEAKCFFAFFYIYTRFVKYCGLFGKLISASNSSDISTCTISIQSSLLTCSILIKRSLLSQPVILSHIPTLGSFASLFTRVSFVLFRFKAPSAVWWRRFVKPPSTTTRRSRASRTRTSHSLCGAAWLCCHLCSCIGRRTCV